MLAAQTVAGLRYIVSQFSLELPGPVDVEHVCVTARIPDAGASFRSVLQLRHQLAPAISSDVLERDTAFRLKQQQDLQLIKPQDGNFWEAQLERKLLNRPPRCLRVFPYLYSREWESADGGQGDLVFTDGQGLFAVVELKYINSSNSHEMQRRKRKFVKEQARKYGQAFTRQHAEAAVVIAGTYTEEEKTVQWISLEDQAIKRVHMLVQVAAASKANRSKHQHGHNPAALLRHASRQTTYATANLEVSTSQSRVVASACVPRSAHAAHQLAVTPPNLSEETPAAEQQPVQQVLPTSLENKALFVAGTAVVVCFVYSAMSGGL